MYILIGYGLFSLFSILSVTVRNQKHRVFDVLAGLLLIALVFSFPLGKDLVSYVMAFDRVTSFSDAFIYHTQRNFGFNAMLYICKLINPNYQFFRLVVNVICISLVGYTIFKNSKSFLLSVTLLLGSGVITVYYASGIRQMLAMSVYIFAYFAFLQKKKYASYFLCSILSISFHEIGIIMIILPLVLKAVPTLEKHPGKTLLIGLLISIGGFLLIRYGMPFLIHWLGYDSTLTHALYYFTETRFSLSGLLLRIILFLFNAFLYMMVKKQDRTSNDSLFLTVSFLSFLIYVVFCDYSIMSRVSDFIAMIEIVMLPNLIMKIERPKLKIISVIGMIGINAVLLYSDMRDKTNVQIGSKTYTMETYPYIPIYNTQAINEVIGS